MRVKLYKPGTTDRPELFTEAELHKEFLVKPAPHDPGNPLMGKRADGSERHLCPHCRNHALLSLIILPKAWAWCSYCGCVVNQLHAGFVAPDLADGEGK